MVLGSSIASLQTPTAVGELPPSAAVAWTPLVADVPPVTPEMFVVFGVIGTRFVIVVPGLVIPDMEGLAAGVYVGTIEVWALTVGLVAFGALLYTIGAELLPLRPLKDGDH